MNDDDVLDIDVMLSQGDLPADPRTCPWCGERYFTEPAVFSIIVLRDGGTFTTEGAELTFSRCARDGILVIS